MARNAIFVGASLICFPHFQQFIELDGDLLALFFAQMHLAQQVGLGDVEDDYSKTVDEKLSLLDQHVFVAALGLFVQRV